MNFLENKTPLTCLGWLGYFFFFFYYDIKQILPKVFLVFSFHVFCHGMNTIMFRVIMRFAYHLYRWKTWSWEPEGREVGCLCVGNQPSRHLRPLAVTSSASTSQNMGLTSGSLGGVVLCDGKLERALCRVPYLIYFRYISLDKDPEKYSRNFNQLCQMIPTTLTSCNWHNELWQLEK